MTETLPQANIPPKTRIVEFSEHVFGSASAHCNGGQAMANLKTYRANSANGKVIDVTYEAPCPGTCRGIIRQVTVTP